ncbi:MULTISPECIES: NAD(P)-dependent oxidoreductase [unclassified Chelatococcus]|uniref:NAD(P)-dependent oxidoreductase n=1 Tax=unclassified Chelatococcus TaxID=2638111 RepID=UPI001BCE2FA7|nr:MULTISPECIES: NAD(P)-dependent oxidoreductase [unclassified Chelatococcus]MBS7700955.1 hydroxyacid dehydrogenase [Chelatococcus sp. YT9]MBX3555488.1 hydroxyacid dehydrogenase [Chelatococcus sp.]
MTKPVVLLDPFPRQRQRIFNAAQWERLSAMAEIIEDEQGPMRDSLVEARLPEAVAIIGQTALPTARVERAAKLRAVLNVEGNFYQNIDYHACLARGIAVLSIAPAFAVPVAEMVLALALDLARGITAADGAVRAGRERYGLAGNADALLISEARVGLIGYGNIGRALRRLLNGFAADIQVYDPWFPDNVLRAEQVRPADLGTVLSTSRFLFILAGVTSDNQGFLGRPELERIGRDSVVVLGSRAGVVDFEAFVDLANAGRFRGATDVFPAEPIGVGDPVRQSRLLLSPHRAGGIPAAMEMIGEMVLDDLGLVLRGLPPQRMQPARWETVCKMRSPPAQGGHPTDEKD